MAKKDLDADAVSRSSPVDTVPPGIWYIAGVSLIGWIMYRTGYAAGTSISSQVLRRQYIGCDPIRYWLLLIV